MNLNSKELKELQNLIDDKIENLVNSPENKYEEIHQFLYLAGKIDTERRVKWNEEKFGVCDKIADECLTALEESSCNYTADDIPF